MIHEQCREEEAIRMRFRVIQTQQKKSQETENTRSAELPLELNSLLLAEICPRLSNWGNGDAAIKQPTPSWDYSLLDDANISVPD